MARNSPNASASWAAAPVTASRHRGKGSHGTLYYGDKYTTVKHGEIGPGLLAAMLRDLGLKKRDL